MWRDVVGFAFRHACLRSCAGERPSGPCPRSPCSRAAKAPLWGLLTLARGPHPRRPRRAASRATHRPRRLEWRLRRSPLGHSRTRRLSRLARLEGDLEPDRLAARTLDDAPLVRHRLDDPKPATGWLAWGGVLRLGVPGAGVARLDAHRAIGGRLDRYLEVRVGMPDTVGGELAHHQRRSLQGFEGLTLEGSRDEPSRLPDGLAATGEFSRLFHGSICRTPVSPVTSMRRLTIGGGLRTRTVSTSVAT